MRYEGYLCKKVDFPFRKLTKLVRAIDRKFKMQSYEDKINSLKEFIIFVTIITKKIHV